MFVVTNDVYLEFSCSNIELYGDTTLCLRVEFRLLSILYKTPLLSRQIVLFNYGEIGRFAMAKIRPLYGYYTATIRPLQNLRLANGGRPKQRSGGPGQWKCYTFKRPGSWGMPRRTLRRWRVVVAEARLGDELALSGGIRGEPTLRDCVTQGKIILQRASSQPKLGALFLVGACLKPIKKKSSN